MRKRVWKSAAVGVLAGISADAVTALIVSWVLRLGYYSPCLASWPERFGGELNAILAQMVLFALLGAALAVAVTLARGIARKKRNPPCKAPRAYGRVSHRDREGRAWRLSRGYAPIFPRSSAYRARADWSRR